MRAAWWAWAVVAVGCARQGSERAVTEEKASGEASCRPAALASARTLPGWQAPETCRWKGGVSASGTTVRSDAELAALLDCQGGPSGFDFRANALVVSAHTLSPATLGVEALDDGQAITWLSRSRPNCPKDPLPMPITQTLAVIVPADASRALRQGSCTVPRTCDR